MLTTAVCSSQVAIESRLHGLTSGRVFDTKPVKTVAWAIAKVQYGESIDRGGLGARRRQPVAADGVGEWRAGAARGGGWAVQILWVPGAGLVSDKKNGGVISARSASRRMFVLLTLLLG